MMLLQLDRRVWVNPERIDAIESCFNGGECRVIVGGKEVVVQQRLTVVIEKIRKATATKPIQPPPGWLSE